MSYFPATIRMYAGEFRVPMKTCFTSFIFSPMRACRSVSCHSVSVLHLQILETELATTGCSQLLRVCRASPHDYVYRVCVGLEVSISASHVVGLGIASRLVHIKNHHKNGTNCLPGLHACVRAGV